MVASVPSIRADLRGDNIANLFGETSQGGDVSRDNYPERKSVDCGEEIIRHRARCAPVCCVFREPIDTSRRQRLVYQGKDD